MTIKPTLVNPALPPKSTILITGVNGLIGSHCVDQALAAGFKVRGTVREIKRCTWMNEHFDKAYKPGLLELVEVDDVYQKGYLNEAVKGISAVIHTVPSKFSAGITEIEPATTMEITSVIAALEAANNEPSVKRFVLTSSAWAAGSPMANTPYTLTRESFNENAVRQAYATDPAPNGLQMYMALKTRMEQEAWKWIREHQPAFVFNSVLPDTTMGHIIDPENQSLKTTGGLVKVLYDGGPDMIIGFMRIIGPQWYLGTADCGRLHLIAAVDPEVQNERIFGHAGRFTWDDILDVLRRMYPEKKFIDNFEQGEDIGNVPTDRGNELLKKHYGTGWTSLEECVKANILSFVAR